MVANICPRCGFPNDPGVTTCRKCKLAYTDSQADHSTTDIYGGGAPAKPDTSYTVIPSSKPGQPASAPPLERKGSVPPTKLNLDFSDEAPPGEAPVAVPSDLRREVAIDRGVVSPIAQEKSDRPAPDAASERPVRAPDLPKSKGIRITLAESGVGKAEPAEGPEPSELGAAPEFSDAGPASSSSIHKAARPRPPDRGTSAPPVTPAAPSTPGARDGRAAVPSGPGRRASPAAPAISAPGIPVHESWIEYSEPLKPRDLVAAGFLRRAVAGFIDFVLLGAAVAGVAWLGLASFGSSPALQAGLQDTGRALAALGPPLGLLFAAIVGLYSLAFHFLAGRTIGKMVAGLRVITTKGDPLSLWRALGRTVAYLATAVTFLIGFLWILVDDRGQAIHDKIAGTFVIIEGE